jgi:uncharacterized protein YjiS (DUF1127 family)
LSRISIDVAGAPRRRAQSAAPAIIVLIGRVQAMVSLWRARVRDRRALAQMSERQRADIGVCWSQIADEASRPFWRE